MSDEQPSKPTKYHYWTADVGWSCPQVKIQIIPFKWGIGGGIGHQSVSLLLGPFSIRIYFRFGAWGGKKERAGVSKGWTYD